MEKFQTVIFAVCWQQCLKEVRTYALQLPVLAVVADLSEYESL